ncbi:DUF4393 domain-containing protein [Flavobacterium sp. WLB]|uniref:DUF4393 domain-containing protein n=1 Tax=unclassified Flavobacterium TaxID=196869 RepID=UPI0006ABCDBC|nr:MULTISPECIES: DUF4393 domain-containing protein [unclassified Flavobacterium]KOP38829.1 hypothetical protein AKO67_07270 [Flavobacterium sp. VMW]OWU92768.1 hypothetical protein APR43_01535 [Flavobacterium sp. NLM]PUU71946.1 DUF4393 domain-containing protein [Flavobacterium sp. WLB]
MEDNENKETNVKATIDAVTGLVKAIPIYQDTLQPSAQQIGKSLETVTKAVNIALAPIKGLVWGYEKIEEFISQSVTKKLQNVPEENIITPSPSIAGPTIEALRFTGEDLNLRELYSNLLANAMNNKSADSIHPGYVEIIKNLSSDEALILQTFCSQNQFPLIDLLHQIPESNSEVVVYKNFSYFMKLSNLKKPDLTPVYIDNICRLGLTEIPVGKYIISKGVYERLENDNSLFTLKADIVQSGKGFIDFNRKLIRLTNFGQLFINNVVAEKK